MGTNVLVGQDMNRLREELARVLRGEKKHGVIPPLWDGQASERIADILTNIEPESGSGAIASAQTSGRRDSR